MDRKLDAWVAENVFNHEVREHPIVGGLEYDSGVGFDPLPKYTSDMNEAVKVAEKLNLVLVFYEEWGLTCYEEEDTGNYDTELAQKIGCHPYTICMAAYKLKTGKDWEY